MMNRYQHAFLSLILLASFCFTSEAVKAQTISPGNIETCDGNLSEWESMYPIRQEDGACWLEGLRLSYKGSLADFHFHNRVFVPAGGEITLEFGASIFDEYKVFIQPGSTSLKEYTGNNRSSTVNEKQLASSSGPMESQWTEMELRLENQSVQLGMNGGILWSVDIPRLSTGFSISGSKGTAVDDLSIEKLDLSVSGQSLESFSPELVRTWIAFIDQESTLTLIHPDGSERTEIKKSIKGNFLQAQFSRDGKFLAIIQFEDGTKEITFLDMQSLQFLPTKVQLLSSQPYDWMPDNQHIVRVVGTETQSTGLEIIDVRTNEVTRQVQFPAQADQRSWTIGSVHILAASPSEEKVYLSVYAQVDGSSENLKFFFDVSTLTVSLLTFGGDYIWSADGMKLYATAGGEVDVHTLRFQDWPQDFTSNVGTSLMVSPNGRYIAGDEKNDKRCIFDLANQKVFWIPKTGWIEWAPDSRHIVYADSGRIIVRELTERNSLQIAQGDRAIWQPDPEMIHSSLLQMTVTPTIAVPSPAPSRGVPQATPTSAKVEAQVAETARPTPVLPASSPTNEKPAATKSIFPILLVGVGITGLGGCILLLVSMRKLKCAACSQTNPAGSLFCMNCGKPIAPTRSSNRPQVILGIILSGAIVLIGGILLIKSPSEAENQLTPSPVVLENQPAQASFKKPTETSNLPTETSAATSSPLSEEKSLCDRLQGTSINLKQVFAEIEKVNQEVGQKYSDFQRAIQTESALGQTPSPEKIASFQNLFSQYCTLNTISFSPSGQYALAGFTSSGGGNRISLFQGKDYQLQWTIQYQHMPDDIQWAPDESKFGENQEGNITVIDRATGKILAAIPASTRSGSICTPFPLETGFRWLADSQQIVRKISNAIQYIEASTGNILKEVPTEDDQMSTSRTEGTYACHFSVYWMLDGSQMITIGIFPTEGDWNARQVVLKVWDISNGSMVHPYPLNGTYPENVSLVPGGNAVRFNNTYENATYILDFQTGQIQMIPALPDGNGAESPFILPDGNQLFSLAENSVWRLDFQLGSWQKIGNQPSPPNASFVTWLPGGKRFLVSVPNENPDILIYVGGKDYWVFELQTGNWVKPMDLNSIR